MEEGLIVEKRDFIRSLKKLIDEANDEEFEDYDSWNGEVIDLLEESFENADPIIEKFDGLEIWKRNGELNFNATLDKKTDFLEKIVSSLNSGMSVFGLFLFLGAVVAGAALLSTPRKIFIIHGREEKLLREVKEYVLKTASIEPTILSEQANRGMTVIEKLQGELKESDYAIALMTG